MSKTVVRGAQRVVIRGGYRAQAAKTAAHGEAQLPRLLCTIEEAGQMLGYKKSKVYELINEGFVPTVTIGKCKKVPIALLQQRVMEMATAQQKAVRQ